MTNDDGLSVDQAHELFDQACRARLGCTGEEFLARWDAGEWRDHNHPDHCVVADLMMLIPLVRPKRR